jgi:predicted RNA-binding protein associated with RNAse of E/G family
VILAIHTFSSLFFWFLVILSGYWFIFFKLQERVYLLLPAVDHNSPIYYSFDVVFGLVVATKVISVLYKIFFD